MVSITVDSTNYSAAPRWDSNGKGYYYVYASSGCVVNTPTVLSVGWNAVTGGCGWTAVPVYDGDGSTATVQKLIGVPEAVIASGCMGWVQFAGYCSGIQAGSGSVTGSVGHALVWSIAAIVGNDVAYTGAYNQIGTLCPGAASSYVATTTVAAFLNGKYICGT